MPEERTVSAFTWMSPPLRSKILVRQMAWRTKVRQYYTTEAKVWLIIHLVCQCLNLTEHSYFKPRKNSTPRPTVKFYDVKSKIFSKKDATNHGQLPDDDEDDSWLDEPEEAVYDSAQELEAESTSPINLASQHLASFLADDSPDTSNSNSGSSQNTATGNLKPHAAATIAQEDNDFSMEF